MQMSSAIPARYGSTSAISGSALSMPGEFEPRPKGRRIRADERIALPPDNLRWNRFSLVLRELRLVVKQIELARRPRHEKMNDRLGSWRRVRGLDCQRIACRRAGRSAPGIGEEGRQRNLPDSYTALIEKVPAGDLKRVRRLGFHLNPAIEFIRHREPRDHRVGSSTTYQ